MHYRDSLTNRYIIIVQYDELILLAIIKSHKKKKPIP